MQLYEPNICRESKTPTMDRAVAPIRERASDQMGASPRRFQHRDVRLVRSEELFGEAAEVVIIHEGMRYRLLRTRRGKLILNK